MVELLKLSSKGQIVIPKAIRNKLNLREGDRLIVFSRGNLIVLRRIEGEESLLNILSKPLREDSKTWNQERRCSRSCLMGEKEPLKNVKVVFDTNAMISTCFWESNESRLMELVEDGKLEGYN